MDWFVVRYERFVFSLSFDMDFHTLSYMLFRKPSEVSTLWQLWVSGNHLLTHAEPSNHDLWMSVKSNDDASPVLTADASNITLRKADLEYKGHRSLLTRTRNLLTTLQRQDVKDRYVDPVVLSRSCLL